jgi:hypothetical protein
MHQPPVGRQISVGWASEVTMEWFLTTGYVAFGLVMGWITNGFFRRKDRNALTDVTTVVGAIGGAAVTGTCQPETRAFAVYCVGLAVGFFGYLAFSIGSRHSAWLGNGPGA